MPRSEAIRRPDPVGAAATSRHAAGVAVNPAGMRRSEWQVAEEVPLAILLNGEDFAVMMVTPADLEDFVLGFALTEGLVGTTDDIRKLSVTRASDGYMANVSLDPQKVEKADGRRRRLAGRSGCGVCGAQSLAAAITKPRRVRGSLPETKAIHAAFAGFSDRQVMRRENHSTHAAALCGQDGRILLIREDIGRHNALDKLAGAVARGDFDVTQSFVLLSSRVSYEMVQKSAAIGVPLVAAASAPSALSLRVAKAADLTLVVKARDSLMYFHPKDFSESAQ